VIVIVISVLKVVLLCSFWSGCPLVHTVVRPVRGQDGRVHAFHAIRWSRVFHHGLSGVVSHPDGAQAFGHDCWNRRLVRWDRE